MNKIIDDTVKIAYEEYKEKFKTDFDTKFEKNFDFLLFPLGEEAAGAEFAAINSGLATEIKAARARAWRGAAGGNRSRLTGSFSEAVV